MGIETPGWQAEPQNESSEIRRIFPFIRTPLKLYHLVPIAGPVVYLLQDRDLMNKVQNIGLPNKGKSLPLSLITMGVSTWSESRNQKERIEHIKTQVIHGAMGAYMCVSSQVVLLGIWEMTKL